MNLIYILYFLLSPLIYLFLLVLIPFNAKVRERWIKQRKTLHHIKKKSFKNPIVIHAASAGEFEQVKPLLSSYDKKNPIIQTFFSPTIYNQQNKSNLFDACCYHPFDFPWSAFFFFRNIKPKAYIVNRHDIWPHFIIVAKIMKIKIYYINANLSVDSLRIKYFKNFHCWLFKKMDFITTPSNEISNRFEKYFNIKNIKTLQDTRYMQITNRIRERKKVLPDQLLNQNNIILGSIDETDWDIIKINLKKISEQNKIIIVPHEIDLEFIKKIEKDLKELKLKSKRLNSTDRDFDCLIYDKIGDLLDLYRYGKGAYVGCGFSGGVHNVLEPLLQGCFVAYGPKIALLDEATKLDKSELGQKINNGNDFLKFISKVNNEKFVNDNRDEVSETFKLKLDDFNEIQNIIFND